MVTPIPDSIRSNMALPVGGAVADKAAMFFSTLYTGSADPEGSVTAPVGSIYFRSTGVIYGKQTGSGDTGWVDLSAGGAAGAVLESDYNANTILAADTDDTPAALTMGASTILARLAAGNIKAASVAEILTLLGTASLYVAKATMPVELGIAVGDETTAITTGTAKVTFRMPYAMTVTAVRANLATASSSGTPTVDINDSGTTILSTKLTIDANELTSTTAASAAVISDSALADDAEITIDIDVAGTGAKGLKVWIIGTRVAP